jgi:hypothetical protein
MRVQTIAPFAPHGQELPMLLDAREEEGDAKTGH